MQSIPASEDAGRLHRPSFNHGIEVALSGGGLRASAFALGALIYLVQSGLNRKVDCIASVSGGSITNAYVASLCDFKRISEPEEIKEVAAQLAKEIAYEGLTGGRFLFTVAYLVTMLAWALGILTVSVVWRPWTATHVALMMLVLVAWLAAALCRGIVVAAWLRRLFGTGRKTFGDVSGRAADHVICATDLCSSAPFFFSTKGGGRLFNGRYGRGDGRNVALDEAVYASAAFPPAIPRMRFSLANRGFEKDVPSVIYLSDGGVWNNVATDWSRMRAETRSGELRWIQSHEEVCGEIETLNLVSDRSLPDTPGRILIVVDASAPPTFSRLQLARWPLLAALTTAKRSIDVSYNSTLAARMADLVHTAKMRMLNDPPTWELNRPKPAGQEDVWGEQRPLELAVSITRKPGQIAKEWSMFGGLQQWGNAEENYQRELSDTMMQEVISLIAGDNSSIPTTLKSLGRARTLSLVVHGYLGVRELLTGALAQYDPEPPLSKRWFEDLIPNRDRAS